MERCVLLCIDGWGDLISGGSMIENVGDGKTAVVDQQRDSSRRDRKGE